MIAKKLLALYYVLVPDLQKLNSAKNKNLSNHDPLNYIYKLLKKTATFQTLNYHSKLTLDSAHIRKKSKLEIQEKLDEYSAKGYRLTSTNSTNFELAI